MSDKTFALYAIAALAVLTVTQRKMLLSLTTIGIFYASHIVLLAVGLLATPWLIDSYLAFSFPYLHIEYFSSADVRKAIVLVVGGMVLTIVGYRTAMTLDTSTLRMRSDLGLLYRRYPIIGTGIRPLAVRICLALCLAIVVAILAAEAPSIMAALAAGLQGESYYAARSALETHGRLFAYAALNVLPFLAACVAGAAWYKRQQVLPSYGVVLATIVVSVLTFKKSYLLIELLALLATWYVVKTNGRQWEATEKGDRLFVRGIQWKVPKTPLILIFTLFFSFATASYYLVAGGGLSLPLAIGFAFERVFSRLTMMALMYAHYFPAVHDYYGVTNVGLFSDVMGTPLYEDTVVTLEYFSRLTEEGSGACGALIDFYGGFGWPGWVILSILLGSALYALDRWISRLPPLLINRILHVFMLLTVTFLAQASIFRTLSTYGGGILVGLWLLLANQKGSRPSHHVQHEIGAPRSADRQLAHTTHLENRE